jgi:hypothetical protein
MLALAEIRPGALDLVRIIAVTVVAAVPAALHGEVSSGFPAHGVCVRWPVVQQRQPPDNLVAAWQQPGQVYVGKLRMPRVAVVSTSQRDDPAEVGNGHRLGPGPVQLQYAGPLLRRIQAGDLGCGPLTEKLRESHDHVTRHQRTRRQITPHNPLLFRSAPRSRREPAPSAPGTVPELHLVATRLRGALRGSVRMACLTMTGLR